MLQINNTPHLQVYTRDEYMTQQVMKLIASPCSVEIYQSLRIDKRLTPHFLFAYNCRSWSWDGPINQMNENRIAYESPQIEVMEIAVEQGFANSNVGGGYTPRWQEGDTPTQW